LNAEKSGPMASEKEPAEITLPATVDRMKRAANTTTPESVPAR
jgi:hypothetical protein